MRHTPSVKTRVAVLAGGVGGARMALGFAQLPDVDLSVVVNVGDDDWFHGLKVCPDLDTILYTLSGVVNPTQGWGVAGDTTQALDTLRKLESPDTWMTLGDADLGLHIYRTHALRLGTSLTDVMDHVARRYGIAAAILPVTDDEVPTTVKADGRWLRFQEWFVQLRGGPAVTDLAFPGAEHAKLTDPARRALSDADLIVIAPSNPLVSIDPLLAIDGLRCLITDSSVPRVAISPLIGGQAVKGPLVKMLEDLGEQASLQTIAERYTGLIDALVVDESESVDEVEFLRRSVAVLPLPTLMSDAGRSRALASKLLSWGRDVKRKT